MAEIANGIAPDVLKSHMPPRTSRESQLTRQTSAETADGSLAPQNSLASHTVRELEEFLETSESGARFEQQPDSEDSESDHETVHTFQSREPTEAGEPARETLALPQRSLDKGLPEFKPSQSFDPDYQFGHHQWGN